MSIVSPIYVCYVYACTKFVIKGKNSLDSNWNSRTFYGGNLQDGDSTNQGVNGGISNWWEFARRENT